MNDNSIYTFYKNLTRVKAHIAHKSLSIAGKKRCHPLSVDFLLGCKNKVAIINPIQTFEKLLKSLHVIAFFSKKKKDQGYLLIVNTNPEYVHFIENFYQSNLLKNFPISYCNEKWVGGLLTNWKQVSKSVNTFMAFKEQFSDFILQNNIHFPRYKKLNTTFQGLKRVSLKKRPSLIFLINPNENRHVVEEAVSLKIPVIAITDSNTNLLGIPFPIPGNSNSIEFVHYCLEWITRIMSKSLYLKKKEENDFGFFTKKNKKTLSLL